MNLIGTIIAAVLGLVGVVWAAKITRRSQGEMGDKNPAPIPPEKSLRDQPKPLQPQPPRRKEVTDLDLMDIVTAVKAAKPILRDAVHANYVGLRVRWRGKLRGISRSDGARMFVTVSFRNGETLGFCSANADEVVGLEHADEGSPVEVTGSIKEATMEYEVTLEDCVIRRIPAPAST